MPLNENVEQGYRASNRLSEPGFFVVGAQRAGTTTLHHWLSQQPDVCLPVLKETHFFSDPEIFKRGISWYRKQFSKCTRDPIWGEVDPEYMFFEEALSRISWLFPAPKLIFIFRHPIERAYSHYLMTYRRELEQMTFADALRSEDERLSTSDYSTRSHYSYFSRGRYVEQIDRCRAIFPDSEFLFIRFEDLFSFTWGAVTYSTICQFIGIQSDPITPDVSQKHNPASAAKSAFLTNFVHGSSWYRRLGGALIPSRRVKTLIMTWIDRHNQQPIQSAGDQDWGQMVPSDMIDAFNQETLKLQRVTGWDLADWLV
jgi:hypothetical protein